MDSKVIVIGATGVVGRALVDLLAESQSIDKIITITRRPDAHQSLKVTNHVIDFDKLHDFADIIEGDCLFSCLGTTKKLAGSIANQRKVDFDYQLNAARIAKMNSIPNYFLVSSSGANKASRSAYLKMKGELEVAIKALEFKSTHIVQPSLLVGQRKDFRLAEKVAGIIMPLVCKLPFFKRFRPITGEQVAAKMLAIYQQKQPGTHTYSLDQLFM